MVHLWDMRGTQKHGFYVDRCSRCGALRLTGGFVTFVRPQEANKFLTTNQRVEMCEYFPCEEVTYGDN